MKEGGTLSNNFDAGPRFGADIRLVEQTEQTNIWSLRVCLKENKPGSAQVGAISKAQKYQKDFKMSKYW